MTYHVGFVGLGKLGLPISVAMAWRGVHVVGTDMNPDRMDPSKVNEIEQGSASVSYKSMLQEMVDCGRLSFVTSIKEVVEASETIFIAVQTPHEEQFDGTKPVNVGSQDFDYRSLQKAIYAVLGACYKTKKVKTVVIISTVLPGTMDNLLSIVDLRENWVRIVYNPYFIAMGNVIPDFYYPEFVLVGVREQWRAAVDDLIAFYDDVLPSDAPVVEMSIASAELTKVAYNTYISMKLAVINVLAHAAQSVPGCNIDEISMALKRADRRIAGTGYMTAGMGDGGGCHPRDNIAMSWFAEKHGLHYDIFKAAMAARDNQAKWFADLFDIAIQRKCDELKCQPGDLAVGMLGTAFKPGWGLETGSHALLVQHYIHEMWPAIDLRLFDPFTMNVGPPDTPGISVVWDVTFVGCAHPIFATYKFRPGAVVIDPARIISQDLNPDVSIQRIGIGL